MNAHVLITGGAGFIGCAVAQRLLNGGVDGETGQIVAADCLHPQVHPEQKRPEALPKPVALAQMDVSDAAAWDELLRHNRVGTLIHLAAETGTAQSIDVPVRHVGTNVGGTAQMIEAFDRLGVIPDHVILASSRAIYGEGLWLDPETGRSFSPARRSLDALNKGEFRILSPSGRPAEPLVHDAATTSARPISVYGATKLAQEHLLSFWCEARGVRLTILRFQNVYGPGQSPQNPYTGIVGLFHQVAAAGAPIDVYEDGQIGRDFVFIDDVAEYIVRAISASPASLHTRILDVGRGKALTIIEAARSIASLYKAPEPIVSGKFRTGDVRWAAASVDALHRELGEVPATSFDEGNKRLSGWLRERGVLPTSAAPD